MHPARLSARSRRGHALSALVILLALIALGLITWKTFTQVGLVPVSHPFAADIKSKIVTTNVATVLAALAITGGIGAGCYHAFGRSQRAANAGMAVPLLLLVGTFSFQAYLYLSGGGAAGAQSRASARRTPSVSAPGVPSPTPSATATTEDRARRIADALRSSAPLPPGVSPAPYTPSPSPAVAPQLPPATPASRPVLPEPDPAIERVSTETDESVAAAAADVAAKFESVAESMAKLPPRHKTQIEARIASYTEARDAASALARRLRGVRDEVERKLRDAGLSERDAQGPATHYAASCGCGVRAHACESVVRALDAALHESEFLRDRLGAWTVDKEGRVASKDFMLQSEARGMRMRVESEYARRRELIDGVKGS